MKSKRRFCYGVLGLPATLIRRLHEAWSAIEPPARSGPAPVVPDGPPSLPVPGRAAEPDGPRRCRRR